MKRFSGLYFAVSLAVLFIVLFVPAAVFAQTGTLSNDNPPYVYAEYFDENNNRVDGGELSSGTYTMNIMLSGISSISQMEITAAYGEELSFNSYSTPFGNDSSNFAIAKIANGSLVLCIVSNNADCTQISGAVTLLTASITIASPVPVDMDDVITPAADADLTFIEADYGDVNSETPNIFDCYALGKTGSYLGEVYTLNWDMSPELPTAKAVTGTVVKMLNPDAPDDATGAPVIAGVSVSVGEQTIYTNENGQFTLLLESGSYQITFHYVNGYNRKMNIVVSDSDLDLGTITIVPCDYDNNGTINVADTTEYLSAFASKNVANGDLDGNGVVNVADTTIYKAFFAKKIVTGIYN